MMTPESHALRRDKTPREGAIVTAILRFLRGLPNCYAEKRHGDVHDIGNADIYGCFGGRHFEFECKVPGRALRPHQLAMLRRWQQAGAIVGKVEGVNDVRKLLGLWLPDQCEDLGTGDIRLNPS